MIEKIDKGLRKQDKLLEEVLEKTLIRWCAVAVRGWVKRSLYRYKEIRFQTDRRRKRRQTQK